MNKQIIDEFDKKFGLLFTREQLKKKDGNFKPYARNEDIKKYIKNMNQDKIKEAIYKLTWAIMHGHWQDLDKDIERILETPEETKITSYVKFHVRPLDRPGVIGGKEPEEEKKEEKLEYCTMHSFTGSEQEARNCSDCRPLEQLSPSMEESWEEKFYKEFTTLYGMPVVVSGELKENYRLLNTRNADEIKQFIQKVIDKNNAEERKKILDGLKKGILCTNCLGEKNGLSDWCVDCLENN